MIKELDELMKKRDTEGILELLDSNPEVLNELNENGSTGFAIIAYSGMPEVFAKAISLKETFTYHEAILAGKIEIVKGYLDADLPNRLNEYSNDGFAPIALAAFFNQIEIAELLAELGADPNLAATNPTKVNALHAAVAKENTHLCKLLIAKGANVNASQMADVTPLHSAVHRGNVELTRLLLDFGAQPDLKMQNGDTAMIIAEREGHQPILDILRNY
ncbi:MAG TPA: ankyrin repeat domain-containing protein [Saprospiraceae bacterium]|nr:ankyrin repeat domain-containing protein [Saprospiraceae bacterium]HPN72025.1 ankyrin repeat domain-containing protein [Saprospiraceae bacterium]